MRLHSVTFPCLNRLCPQQFSASLVFIIILRLASHCPVRLSETALSRCRLLWFSLSPWDLPWHTYLIQLPLCSTAIHRLFLHPQQLSWHSDVPWLLSVSLRSLPTELQHSLNIALYILYDLHRLLWLVNGYLHTLLKVWLETILLVYKCAQLCSQKGLPVVKQQFKHSLHLSDNVFKKTIHSCLNEFWEQEIVTSFAEMYMGRVLLSEDYTMVTPLTACPSVKILQRIRLAVLSEMWSRTAAPLLLINMCITVQCNFTLDCL